MQTIDIEKIEMQIKAIDMRGKKVRRLGGDYNVDRKVFEMLRKEIEDSDLPELDKIKKMKELNEQYKYHLEAYKTQVRAESEAIISEKEKEIKELKNIKSVLHKTEVKLSKATFATDTGSVFYPLETLKEKESYADRAIKQSEIELEEFKRLTIEEEMYCYNFDRTVLTESRLGEKSNINIPNQQYVDDTLSALKERMPDIIDREMVLAGAEVQKMRTPKIETLDGELKGTWLNSVFYLDDNFVPKYENGEKLTVAEIKQHLYVSFGIEFDGIPFTNGIADFSSISVATISTKDIVLKSTGMSELEYNSMEPLERTKKLCEVFAKHRRNSNFSLADKVAAERQLFIPGLDPGYTATELADWRKGKFTWDEQVNGGYNLVPTIIHGNISHTGLVSSSDKAVTYFEQRKNDDPSKYSWNEKYAPISIEEFGERSGNDNENI